MILPFLKLIEKNKNLQSLISDESKRISGFPNFSAKTFFIVSVFQKNPNSYIWIVPDSMIIQEIASFLHVWTKAPIITLFEESSKSTFAKALFYIHKNIPSITLVSHDFFENIKVMAPKAFEKEMFVLKKNEQIGVTHFFEKLISIGYENTPYSLEKEGQYVRQGGIINLHPVGKKNPIKIEIFGETIETIYEIDQFSKDIIKEEKKIDIIPANIDGDIPLKSVCSRSCLILDELLQDNDHYDKVGKNQIIFDPFQDEGDLDIGFSSILRYNTPSGFIHHLKEKLNDKWNILIFAEEKKHIINLLKDHKLQAKNIIIIEKHNKENLQNELGFDVYPDGFINHKLKLFVATEHEIFNVTRKRQRSKKAEVDAAFLANLKEEDFVVHLDHGIGRFKGVQKKTVSEITKEYLFLEYAQNDKLFVPVDQAEKINKYIGVDGSAPRLTRLGAGDWNRMTKKIKEETLRLAKELLALYAKREEAKGYKCDPDTELQQEFEDKFPYEPTDGQIESIGDVKRDMESKKTMDRLICGDVGFGKTEVAMRAAFKAVQNNKQVAVLTPITILCNQHYKTFVKRMEGFDVKIAELSRFKTKSEQKQTLEDLKSGKIDVIIGTHGLLQPQVKFKNLGLLIVDEEQRFGVKQKEMLKNKRTMIDILTLTATPIPRTLNMALSGLRDISTITTPPPGRLPIHTEVRRFSMTLIREVILRELARKGQVYFLHNRVQTIDSIKEKLEALIPEAKFIVTHGKLRPVDLEKRILDFKNGKYDVLVSSTIIENGIDLENANTLIVDQAENLGLAQAYQLRGRVGRSKKQAYAYFMYHAQKLRYDAKKRLRAIIEASELGSGFQIAMRDLEIRGAGDILGSEQHGAINAIGVTHFCKLLAKRVDDLRTGKFTEEGGELVTDIKVDLKLSAFIPDTYIPKNVEKIRYYQRLSGVENENDLKDLTKEMEDKYGKLPKETKNLLRIIDLKLISKSRGILAIRQIDDKKGDYIELLMGNKVTPKSIIHLLNHCDKWQIVETKLIATIEELGGKDWVASLKRSIFELKE